MERINQWLMLIANAGVIAGIVFLAYELRVNTQALSVATSTSYLENFMQLSADAAADAEIAALADTATFQGWDAVPLEQRGRVISYRQSNLRHRSLLISNGRKGCSMTGCGPPTL